MYLGSVGRGRNTRSSAVPSGVQKERGSGALLPLSH
jgi:hypothetical protein